MSSSHCLKNPPELNPNYGAGTVRQLGGFNTYVTGPPHSSLAILLISDAFGYEAPKLRKLADKVGGAGYLVVVPDFLYGDPADPSNPHFSVETWKMNHDTGKGCEDAKKLIAALKVDGISAIGAAGFCWGGMVVVKLASSDNIQAAVVLHPGQIKVDEINAIKVPTAILGAEMDHICPAEELKQFGEILKTKADQFESYVKIFAGVGHGWTVRYDDKDEMAVKKAEEAHSDMCNWLFKYVK